jgi:hypothetical protein
MKKKIYTRPVSVTLSDEMFEQIKEITDSWEIRTLSKAVKEMQQKPETQAVIVTMPQKLFLNSMLIYQIVTAAPV